MSVKIDRRRFLVGAAVVPLILRCPTPACEETEDNIEGPFYKPGAPFRAELAPKGARGAPLALAGRVVGTDCRPLGGALLDVWQADAAGAYHHQGYRFRGRLRAGQDGLFQVKTIVPGRYLNGDQYRPAHLHVKVAAEGHASLTTQLYFEGDPHNRVDPWFKPSLALRVSSAKARFDFVLRRV